MFKWVELVRKRKIENFQRALQTAHNVMNMGGFFTWAVAEDDKNSTRHVIQVRLAEAAYIDSGFYFSQRMPGCKTYLIQPTE